MYPLSSECPAAENQLRAPSPAWQRRAERTGPALPTQCAERKGGPDDDDRLAIYAARLLLKEPSPCPIKPSPAAASGVLTTTTPRPSPRGTGTGPGLRRRTPSMPWMACPTASAGPPGISPRPEIADLGPTRAGLSPIWPRPTPSWGY